jgi:hypothetical protein
MAIRSHPFLARSLVGGRATAGSTATGFSTSELMALTDEFRDGLSRVIDGSCSLLYSADVL